MDVPLDSLLKVVHGRRTGPWGTLRAAPCPRSPAPCLAHANTTFRNKSGAAPCSPGRLLIVYQGSLIPSDNLHNRSVECCYCYCCSDSVEKFTPSSNLLNCSGYCCYCCCSKKSQNHKKKITKTKKNKKILKTQTKYKQISASLMKSKNVKQYQIKNKKYFKNHKKIHKKQNTQNEITLIQNILMSSSPNSTKNNSKNKIKNIKTHKKHTKKTNKNKKIQIQITSCFKNSSWVSKGVKNVKLKKLTIKSSSPISTKNTSKNKIKNKKKHLKTTKKTNKNKKIQNQITSCLKNSCWVTKGVKNVKLKKLSIKDCTSLHSTIQYCKTLYCTLETQASQGWAGGCVSPPLPPPPLPQQVYNPPRGELFPLLICENKK